MNVLMLALLLLVFVLLVQLAFIGADLRAIRRYLPELCNAILRRGAIGGICFPYVGEPHDDGCIPDHLVSKPGLGCFIVWEWRGGRWVCRAVPEGVAPSLPPGYPGAFDGDLAKTWQPLNN